MKFPDESVLGHVEIQDAGRFEIVLRREVAHSARADAQESLAVLDVIEAGPRDDIEAARWGYKRGQDVLREQIAAEIETLAERGEGGVSDDSLWFVNRAAVLRIVRGES